jgi:hypothetical protein
LPRVEIAPEQVGDHGLTANDCSEAVGGRLFFFQCLELWLRTLSSLRNPADRSRDCPYNNHFKNSINGHAHPAAQIPGPVDHQ